MHVASIVGDALGARFAGDTRKLADACELVVSHAALAPLEGAYLPPPEDGRYGVIALDWRLTDARADWLRALAVGHLIFGHRRYAAYIYGPDGPRFDASDEAQLARLFAEAFLEAASAGRQHRRAA